jgi:hypothetical protein
MVIAIPQLLYSGTEAAPSALQTVGETSLHRSRLQEAYLKIEAEPQEWRRRSQNRGSNLRGDASGLKN